MNSEIYFKEGFSQEVVGTIKAGETIEVDYNALRFKAEGAVLPTGEYGVSLWKITMYYQTFSGPNASAIEQQLLENVQTPGGQVVNYHSVGSVELPEGTDSIVMWFSYDGHNSVTPDDEPILWDSRYGQNYQFAVQ
jgi:hypothetical protein